MAVKVDPLIQLILARPGSTRSELRLDADDLRKLAGVIDDLEIGDGNPRRVSVNLASAPSSIIAAFHRAVTDA